NLASWTTKTKRGNARPRTDRFRKGNRIRRVVHAHSRGARSFGCLCCRGHVRAPPMSTRQTRGEAELGRQSSDGEPAFPGAISVGDGGPRSKLVSPTSPSALASRSVGSALRNRRYLCGAQAPDVEHISTHAFCSEQYFTSTATASLRKSTCV